ncbi:MAG: ribose-5-phosphate isomerase [Candidatus Yanofskybacteria bacterium RIFCSPHIGHO2_01_FULL_45_42]|uniref:Ribose-5-phosphate isomerase n=3 Tax=Candidatus Yanofskyibacteriota TaxID=1752733 RepID=A0A1F8H5D7_9BACT|nr:MAG: ribose-5-phosphate isomerase [Candidatus Yanofskybacteria bacterium RIFCSPHIGHO2_01_FULL_45_42]OGN15422.1 MAG: ribose-5-phosphate isomerase [Candidatus Yanofskybacteria bacterium RIFCSPHIGHO2_02_FULL_46_19]OGN28332.1 MAG: ribose-5-phosphate isomerase [Candidatus Yanofskybacteria bacterium RIFCSPLOWO2_01_FULL_45_72]OGN32440.1 MAG: ribose-5-phosphate isomerase [Candidatus Yanofskybacteria bacterium RIFCSPLOWO2_02_FULL_45_18]
MIYLATDHRGFALKEKIKAWLAEWDYDFKDMGAFEYDADDDYPDFIRKAAEAVANDPEHSRGIILGASGQGEAMVANRYKGVRAVVYEGGPDEIITLSRQHNNANVLSLGVLFVDEETAKKSIKLWLETPFEGEERHVRRIKKIDEQVTS